MAVARIKPGLLEGSLYLPIRKGNPNGFPLSHPVLIQNFKHHFLLRA